MRACVCEYAHTCVTAYIYIHTITCIYMCVCVCTVAFVHVCACVRVCVRACVGVLCVSCVCVCVRRACVCVHACACACVCACCVHHCASTRVQASVCLPVGSITVNPPKTSVVNFSPGTLSKRSRSVLISRCRVFGSSFSSFFALSNNSALKVHTYFLSAADISFRVKRAANSFQPQTPGYTGQHNPPLSNRVGLDRRET